MIDIEKFICSLLTDHPEGVAVRGDIHRALKEQGLEYKDGKIVPIEDKNELREKEKPNGGIVSEDFNEGDGFYKVNLAYLSKEQVDEIESIVKKWNHTFSKDEKIRKEIIKYIKAQKKFLHHPIDDGWIAWLEKQDKSAEINPDEIIEECYQDNADHIIDIVTEQEKPSEWNEEEERIRRVIRGWIYTQPASFFDGISKEKMIAWLEKQGEQKPVERKDFVSIPFGAFDSEMVNETITIPDGCVTTIEGNKIHIKKKDKSATEAIKLNHIVDNNEMVESNFKAGDWVVRKDGETFRNGRKSARIKSIKLDGGMCLLDTGRWLYESEIRPWTINDAEDGDLIYVSTEEKGIGAIFNKFDNGIIYFHCYICGDFTQGGYMSMDNVELIYPWQEVNHQRFFQKMREAGYTWDSGSKELIKIE